jgi:hypothetical protein
MCKIKFYCMDKNIGLISNEYVYENTPIQLYIGIKK